MTGPPREAPPGTPAWIEAQLQSRLGPGARLGALSFEGRLLHLRGASLPLGRGASLRIAHAVVELGAGLPLGDLPLSLRVVGLRCEVHLAFDGRTHIFPIELSATEGAENAWAHGTLRLGGASGIASTLEVRPSGWSLQGPRLSAEGTVSPPGLSRLRARGFPLALFPELPGELELTGAFDADLEARGPLSDLEIRGRVSADELLLLRLGATGARLAGVSILVDASRRHLHYRDVEATLFAHGYAGRHVPCQVRGWGRIPLAPPSAGVESVPLLALSVEGADWPLLLGLGGSRLARLPFDASLRGEISVSAARAVSGTIALETPRSALLLHLSLDEGGSLLGSTLRGRFAAADAGAIGLSTGPVRPQPGDTLTLDTRLTGTLSRPGIAGRVAAEHLSLRIGRDDQGSPPFVIEVDDASVLLDVGPDGLAWQGLTGRFYGGRVTSSGRVGRASGALEATIAWSGVTLDALPARSSGEPAVGALLAGRASGELRFDRESRAERALEARGHVTVSEPVYHFVRRFAPTLARYGLPAVSRRGAGPLVAEMRLARGEIVIEPAAATLDGIEVEGDLRVRQGGDLLGRVHVHLLEGYLSRSPLLALPAALSGRVTIPVYFAGPPTALDVRTDALEILDGLLAGSRAGEAVRSVVGGLRDAARARWGRSPGGPRRR